jgi:hypothetical protein
MSETFRTKNGLKVGDTLLPLLSKFASEYDVRWVEAKWKGLKLNFIHRLLV